MKKYYQFYDGKRYFIKYYTHDEACFACSVNGWKIVKVW